MVLREDTLAGEGRGDDGARPLRKLDDQRCRLGSPKAKMEAWLFCVAISDSPCQAVCAILAGKGLGVLEPDHGVEQK